MASLNEMNGLGNYIILFASFFTIFSHSAGFFFRSVALASPVIFFFCFFSAPSRPGPPQTITLPYTAATVFSIHACSKCKACVLALVDSLGLGAIILELELAAVLGWLHKIVAPHISAQRLIVKSGQMSQFACLAFMGLASRSGFLVSCRGRLRS